MAAYCEVALPVPLEHTFTYGVREGQSPQRGARVIVPFRNEKLIGVVTAIDAKAPADFEVRYLEAVLDEEPLLSEHLLELAQWTAQYYLAPLGEVLRAMLPLAAEIRRTVYYRLADLGRDVLAAITDGDSENSEVSKSRPGAPAVDGCGGSWLSHPGHKHKDVARVEHPRRRGNLSKEDQDMEHRVLARLASGEPVKVSTLRTATAASLPLLASMVRKKWIARETAAAERDARRMERFAVLVAEGRLPALTQKQQAILAELASCGGELPLAELRRRDLPSSTLQTLVRRGLVRIEERPQAFRLGGIAPANETIYLNLAQIDALDAITGALGAFRPFLLYGVTGSGKTAVYLAAMQRALDRGLASILLVPEIGLTPQTAGLLDQAFGQKVALLHSALTPEERSEQWRRIRRGETPIVVGTRSAIFAPAPSLGLIIVDEEHDQSYKQEETPRYNARDVAVMRAKLAGAVVVMGSATPSLESWQNAARGKYTRIELRERVMNRPLPEVELIDMRREFRETGRDQLFSRSLVEQTRATLERGEQALILLNRRGYSFAVMCRACGEKLECENCAIALTHHKAPTEDVREACEGQRLAVPLLRLPAHGAGAVPEVLERAPILPRGRVAAGRGAPPGDLSRRAHRAHGPRRRAWALRSGANAGAVAFGRDQFAGGDANDRQGPRYSYGYAGGRGWLRLRAFAARFPGRRARLPVDDAGERARRTRRTAGTRGSADVLSRSLRDSRRHGARLHGFRRARAEIPSLDALPAVRRAGQCAGAVAEARRSRRVGCRLRQISCPKQKQRSCARAGAVYRADRAHQGRLPLSHDPERRIAQGSE